MDVINKETAFGATLWSASFGALMRWRRQRKASIVPYTHIANEESSVNCTSTQSSVRPSIDAPLPDGGIRHTHTPASRLGDQHSRILLGPQPIYDSEDDEEVKNPGS